MKMKDVDHKVLGLSQGCGLLNATKSRAPSGSFLVSKTDDAG